MYCNARVDVRFPCLRRVREAHTQISILNFYFQTQKGMRAKLRRQDGSKLKTKRQGSTQTELNTHILNSPTNTNRKLL